MKLLLCSDKARFLWNHIIDNTQYGNKFKTSEKKIEVSS